MLVCLQIAVKQKTDVDFADFFFQEFCNAQLLPAAEFFYGIDKILGIYAEFLGVVFLKVGCRKQFAREVKFQYPLD